MLDVSLSADRSQVLLRGRAWSDAVPVADLPRLIVFYTGLRDRGCASRPARSFAGFYAGTVRQLESLLRDLSEAQHG